jgi:hypothetical protein
LKRFVDFDGTLVEDTGWKGFCNIGKPVLEMVRKVRNWLACGDEVTLFTARLSHSKEFDPAADGLTLDAVKVMLEEWCVEHLGQKLRVTNEKPGYAYIYDDWGQQIVRNTGMTLSEHLVDYLTNLRGLAVLDGETYAVSTIDSISQKIGEMLP